MKKTIFLISVAAFYAACNNKPSAQANEKTAISTDSTGTHYLVDTAISTVYWEASKLVGMHQGSIKVSEGSFNLKDGNIVSGGFIFAMNTIADSDITDVKYNSDLVKHLKSADFFDVEKFPNGKFEVTSSEVLVNDPNGNTHRISGNLTLKDSSKNIAFPVKVAIADNDVTTDGSVMINRLQFGIVYNSVSVSPASLLKKLGDNAIKDEVEIRFALKSKKN